MSLHRERKTRETKFGWIAGKAREEPEETFTSLAHYLTEEYLLVSFKKLRKTAAKGLDGVGCFDNFDHGILRELLTRRIKDKNIMRLINQWLRTGVVDGKSMQRNTKGTPQGNIISPLMCNVYMHYVIDRFRARRRCLPGDANHTKKNGEIRPDDSSGKEPSV